MARTIRDATRRRARGARAAAWRARTRATVLLLATLPALALVPRSALAQASGVVGTWEKSPFRLVLGAGGRFRLTANSLSHSSGSYRVYGDTVVFREEGRAAVCPAGAEGRYRWTPLAGDLALETLEEACARRAEALAGRGWTRAADVVRRALVGATLVDGTGSPARRRTTILIADGVIEDVFRDGAKQLPPRVEVIQARGRWVIPGLIDSHAVVDAGWESRAFTRRRLADALYGGVTAMRIHGSGDPAALEELRQSARSGLEAPMLILPALVVGRDTERLLTVDGSDGSGSSAGPVVQAVWRWNALERARGGRARGVQFLQGVDRRRIRSFMVGADRLGLRGWSDAALPPLRPSDLVRSGVGLLSDASLLSLEGRREEVDRLLALMAERGASLEPLLSRVVAFRSAATAEQAVEVTRRAREAGVRVVTGTGTMGDRAASPAPDVRDEMRLLVERVGLTPHEALLASTAWAADALGLGDAVGRVVPGHLANLVVLDRDPLEEVPVRGSVVQVFLEGEPYGPPAAGGARHP